MSLILDFLGGLGLGGQVMTAATVAVGAWYLVKAKSGAGTVAALLGNTVGYVVAVLGAAALAIGLGWIDLSVSTMTGHVETAAGIAWDLTGGYVMDAVREVLP